MDIRAIFMGLAFALMWSSAFTSVRVIVAHAPPLAALSVRFLIAGIIAVAIARALGQTWQLTREQWRLTIVFGICQNALYLGLYFVAMQTVEASLAAIIASSLPLWVALSGWLISGDRLPPMGVAGLVAGFAGVAIIMGSRLSAGVDPFGVMLCGLGVLALTFATLALRGASSGGNVLMIVGLQMLIGSAALVVPALLLEEWVITPTWSLTIAFTYTIFIPGLAATFTWFLLVRRIGTVRAATFHFLNPFLGVAIAALFLGEALGPLDILGVAIITAGILAVQLSKVSTRS
ncbi:EamA family transporter [Alphaproteobacteria bacterium GH1-50]|uniref:EamA family transporter n=1 Tax=Kangsaoukella pontilimi TaxID=2691042 RepID=A0A7C9MWF3_9RHOB|nr:DMT family transporter [Kangsaoukella pontilimi]MXQ08340.1 EamA family transporter [Kangsaoukella pontilimi]